MLTCVGMPELRAPTDAVVARLMGAAGTAHGVFSYDAPVLTGLQRNTPFSGGAAMTLLGTQSAADRHMLPLAAAYHRISRPQTSSSKPNAVAADRVLRCRINRTHCKQPLASRASHVVCIACIAHTTFIASIKSIKFIRSVRSAISTRTMEPDCMHHIYLVHRVHHTHRTHQTDRMHCAHLQARTLASNPGSGSLILCSVTLAPLARGTATLQCPV